MKSLVTAALLALTTTAVSATTIEPGKIYEANIDLFNTLPDSTNPIISLGPNPAVQQYQVNFGANRLENGEGFILQALNAANEVLSTTTYTYPIPGAGTTSLGIGFGSPEPTPPFSPIVDLDTITKLRIEGTGIGSYDLPSLLIYVVYDAVLDVNGTPTNTNLVAFPAATTFVEAGTMPPVSAVPLPLPALMLTTALIGLGSFASHRKNSATA